MKRWIFVLIPLLVIGGLIGWRVSQKRAEAAEQNAQRQARGKAAVPVQVTPVKRQDMITKFHAVGSVEAPQDVNITPRLSARILYLQVREGDTVSPGQVLVRLDDSDVQAEVRQKEAAVAQARARLAEAQLGQTSNNATVVTDIEKQRAAVSTAQATERQARADYDAKVAAAQAAVTDADAQVSAAQANIAQADAAIASAKASVDNAQTKLNRNQALYSEGAVAKQVLDDTQTALEVAQAALGEAQQKREAAVGAKASAVAKRDAAAKQVTVTKNSAQATLATAHQGVVGAQASLTASLANRSKTPAYVQNLRALQEAVSAAEADLRVSQTKLADTVLKAPLAGAVTKRYLDPGALASPSTPILALQTSGQVWMNVGVPEESTRSLYRGQPATVSLDAFPGKTFDGKIISIEPAADPQSRQFTVRVGIDNTGARIQPGMFGQATLVTNRIPNALVVPREAVRQPRKPGESPTVVVNDNGKASVRTVKLGATDGQVYQILDGLQDGDQVVNLTGRDLKDGQSIRPATEGELAGGGDNANGGGRRGAGGGVNGGSSGSEASAGAPAASAPGSAGSQTRNGASPAAR